MSDPDKHNEDDRKDTEPEINPETLRDLDPDDRAADDIRGGRTYTDPTFGPSKTVICTK